MSSAHHYNLTHGRSLFVASCRSSATHWEKALWLADRTYCCDQSSRLAQISYRLDSSLWFGRQNCRAWPANSIDYDWHFLSNFALRVSARRPAAWVLSQLKWRTCTVRYYRAQFSIWWPWRSSFRSVSRSASVNPREQPGPIRRTFRSRCYPRLRGYLGAYSGDILRFGRLRVLRIPCPTWIK